MKFFILLYITFISIEGLLEDNVNFAKGRILQMLPGTEDFNIFRYASDLKNDSLLIYKMVDLALNNLIGKNIKNQIINKNKLRDFLIHLAEEYNSNTYPDINPYHNLFHASDIVHTLYLYLTRTKKSNPILFSDTYIKQTEELEFISNINYKDLDIFALIIAAACHDFRHTGRDNNFYSTYKDKVSFSKILKEYDYKLELYHYAEAKKLIEKFDVLENLDIFQKERFYKIMKIAIYGTDNSFNKKHAEDLEKYKYIMNLNNINFIYETLDEFKLIMFECFLHAADISNPTKNRDLFITWTDKVNEEFCEQSIEIHSIDKTKEINCVGNDDTKFKESELSFFKYVIDIFYLPFCGVFEQLNYLCENIEKNKILMERNETIHTVYGNK